MLTARLGRRKNSRFGDRAAIQEKCLEDQKDAEMREKLHQRLAAKLKSVRKGYAANLEKIHALEREIDELKPGLQTSIKAQLDYYYELLREGKDTRNVGLGWIVKSILCLEGALPSPNRYPKYIEPETAQSLNKVRDIMSTSYER